MLGICPPQNRCVCIFNLPARELTRKLRGDAMIDSSISVIVADTPEGTKHCVALTSPRTAFSVGLIPEAIVGLLERPKEPIAPGNFAANSVFRGFLSDVIARNGPEDPDMQAEAARQGQGYVAVIDQRTPTPEGPIPPEDIIGVFEVRDGKVVPGSYQASPNHRLLTKDGFFRLGRFPGRTLAAGDRGAGKRADLIDRSRSARPLVWTSPLSLLVRA